jgi:REP element-mobilizing transposase RayT
MIFWFDFGTLNIWHFFIMILNDRSEIFFINTIIYFQKYRNSLNCLKSEVQFTLYILNIKKYLLMIFFIIFW